MALSMNAQEKKWQREADARTLAEAESIKSTPGRLKGAKAEAKSMAKRAEKEANSLKKVAKKSAAKKATPKRKPAVKKAPAKRKPATKKRK